MLFFNKPLPTYQFVSQNLCLHRHFERSAVFWHGVDTLAQSLHSL